MLRTLWGWLVGGGIALLLVGCCATSHTVETTYKDTTLTVNPNSIELGMTWGSDLSFGKGNDTTYITIPGSTKNGTDTVMVIKRVRPDSVYVLVKPPAISVPVKIPAVETTDSQLPITTFFGLLVFGAFLGVAGTISYFRKRKKELIKVLEGNEAIFS